MPADAPTFTAAQIATALGRSDRGVRKALAAVEPAAEVRQQGGKTAAWHLDQLPEAWRDTLAESARHRGYRSSAHLLTAPASPWQPEIDGAAVKLGDLAEHCITDAQRLQKALLPSILRLTGEHPAPAAEAETKGLAEYRAVFGHAVSVGHWRRLVNRTVDRDGGTSDFSRVELFLAAKLARRPQTAPGYVAAGMQLQNLRGALADLRRPSEPTSPETLFIWTQAFNELTWLAEEGTDAKAAERAVFAALAGSGIRLARTPDALKKSFQRKLARWQAAEGNPSVLEDRRTLPRESARVELPEADRLAIIGHAVGAGGRVSQGFREALEAGKISPATAERIISWPASKSYVPHRIRKAVRDDVAQLADMHHGPRQAKLNGAWIPRDYSDIGPGDVFQADDVTLPVAYWEQTPDGPAAMRGQLLLFVDVATSLILGFALHSERNYNAALIRSTFLRVHDEWGLPRKGVYFERGIWKKSRLLTGRPKDEITMAETELGLREFVRFRHARLPRAKVVENIIGKLQNLIEPEVGYLGRNEQVEKFERIQKKLLEAGRGKIPHGSFLHDKETWTEKLAAYCRKYNSERQDGRLKGQTPAQAYEAGFDYRNPVTRLDGCTRYLLANHRREETVSKNGIRILWRGEPFYYRSAETSRLRGKKVLVWFDVESCPESITVTDLDRRNPVEVPKVAALPSYTATAEQQRAANVQAAAHGSYQKTLYRIIKPHLKGKMFRTVQADLNTALLDGAIKEGRAKVRAGADREQQVARRTSELERELGVGTSQPGRSAETRLRSLELLKQAEEMEAREENE